MSLRHFHPFDMSRESQRELQNVGSPGGAQPNPDFIRAQISAWQLSMRQNSRSYLPLLQPIQIFRHRVRFWLHFFVPA